MSDQYNFKTIIRPAILKFQRHFGLSPRNLCLISGAPRSGTSALCEWLGKQRQVSAFPESRILVSAHKFIEEAHRFQNLSKDSARITNLARQLVFSYYYDSRILIGRRLLVDKEPLEPIAFPSKKYEEFIKNVKIILPDCKLLIAIRDPIATIWSMSRRTWGESLTNVKKQRFTLEEYAENWCACANLTLKLSSDPNTYVVQFARLVSAPIDESRKIFDFLGIHNGSPFQPRQTHEIGFSEKERKKILKIVRPQLEKLRLQGITDLI